MKRSAHVVSSVSRRGFVGGLVALGLHACGGRGEESARCAQCGMRVDTAPSWLAGHGDARFDGPKCLFRFVVSRGVEAGVGWATEYYDAERVMLRDASFVVGSDVLSPMGDDLVPLRTRALAERFAAGHGGRVVGFSEVDEVLLRELR